MLICFVNSYINSGIVYLNLYLSHLCVNPLEHIVGHFTKIHYQNGFAQLIQNSHEFPNSMHHPRIFSSAARVVSTLLLHCGMCGRPRKVLFHICATQYTTVNFDANGNNANSSNARNVRYLQQHSRPHPLLKLNDRKLTVGETCCMPSWQLTNAAAANSVLPSSPSPTSAQDRTLVAAPAIKKTHCIASGPCLTLHRKPYCCARNQTRRSNHRVVEVLYHSVSPVDYS